MREIKFRGRWLEKWYYGDMMRNERVPVMHYIGSKNNFVMVEPDTVGQFTGLKDADGREIYEGDVVRCKHDDWAEEDAEIYAVRYFDDLDYPAFELDGWKDGESNGLSYFTVCGEIHVIGNVYDNPELLERKP